MKHTTIAKRRAAHHTMRAHNSAAAFFDHLFLALLSLAQLLCAGLASGCDFLYRALRGRTARGDRRRRPSPKVREISTFRPLGETRPSMRTLQ